MLRKLMLWAAASPRLVRLFAGLGERSGLSKRFVAGEVLTTALEAARTLNQENIRVSLDLLGEGVVEPAEAQKATAGYQQLLTAISESGVNSNISIKLTQLGLDIDEDLCEANLAKILTLAQELNNWVRIDMEGSEHCERTIRLFQRAHERFGDTVGIVIQAYLHRSKQDIEELGRRGCRVRLCKGAYQEPEEIAFQKKEDVDAAFRELLESMILSNGYTAIATHDHNIVNHMKAFIAKHSVSQDRYEFQMLYGVRRDFQTQLREQGYELRVYVPFGTQWAPYFMRRLAERPANVLFTLRAVFRG